MTQSILNIVVITQFLSRHLSCAHLVLEHFLHLSLGHLALLLLELLRQVRLNLLTADHLVVVGVHHFEHILRRRRFVDGQQLHVKVQRGSCGDTR